MRKLFIFAMIVILSIAFSVNAFAIESQNQYPPIDSKIKYFDDGSYIVETFTFYSQNNYRLKSAAQKSTQGTKSVCYYNGDNELEWEYQLIGTFTYTPGVSSGCISATHNVFIHSNDWSFSNANTYAENNIAHGKGTFKKKL